MKSLHLAAIALAYLTPLVAQRLVAQEPATKAEPLLTASKTMAGHTRLVRCLAYAHDGRLASGGQDRRINLWSRDGRLLYRMQPPKVPG